MATQLLVSFTALMTIYYYSQVWLAQVMRLLKVVKMMKLKEVLRQKTMVAADHLPPTPAEMEH